MVTPVPAQYPKRHRRPVRAAKAPQPAGPVLVAAVFENYVLTLAFDRPVVAGALSLAAFAVMNAADGTAYAPYTAEQTWPDAVRMDCDPIGPYAGAQTTLTATAANNIVAQDGGAAWEGCVGLAVPFP